MAVLMLSLLFLAGEECVQHDGQRGQEEVHQLPGGGGKRQRSRRSATCLHASGFNIWPKTLEGSENEFSLKKHVLGF